IQVPRFCDHPLLDPVGACRQCLVEVEGQRKPLASCTTTVSDGMVVRTQLTSDVAKKAQQGIMELLLVNHPLDCPMCDKGGECPLQNQAMSTGRTDSRFHEHKREYPKPINISTQVLLDRERCVLCQRCTRFSEEIAGDKFIDLMGRSSAEEINVYRDEVYGGEEGEEGDVPFNSYFSGNTVQICPVGALTATPYRFKARPWDLEQVESTCTTCSVGCRTLVQSSRNEILRYQGVDIDPVNWGWLCDKGRFGFESINSTERLGSPLVRTGSSLAPVAWGPALSKAVDALRGADPTRVAVLGGAHLTNEDAFAWAKLAKGVIGTDNVDAQLGDGLPADVVLGLPRATIDQVCAPGGTVLILAADVKEELPVLFLRLRHAVVNDGVTIVELAPRRSSVSDLAATTLLHRPGAEGEVLAALLAGSADLPVGGIEPAAVAAAAELLAKGPVTVILGRANLADNGAGAVAAAAAIRAAHPDVRFLSALRRANVHGALDMGLAPGLLPGRTDLAAAGQWYRDGGWANVPTTSGLDAIGILQAAAAGKIDVLILLGSDPLSSFPDTALATKAIAGARTVIAVEQFLTAAAQQADVVFAAAGWTEVEGTTTNLEGRISTVARKITPPGTARSDWMIAAELARLLGADLGLTSVQEIWTEIEALAPSHAGLTYDALGSTGARDGVVVPIGPAGAGRPAVLDYTTPPTSDAPAPDAYSLRLVATRKLYDRGTATHHSPSLAGLGTDNAVRLHPHDFDRLGIESGAIVTITASSGSIKLPAVPDGGVPKGSAAVLVNQAGPVVGTLIDASAPVTDVRVERA
ncbi:MAG: NADH-quinone oxidoreductase subunit NuoG, partial [Acidimicrobiales bacterium]